MMKIAYRAERFRSQEWCIRNILYMHGLRYNILEQLNFFWSGAWWSPYPLENS